MDLFQAMLPVIQHPRCTNCHGGVDPISGRNHPPGRETPEDCPDCHMTGWTTPAPEHFFVGKSDRELCGLFSDFAAKQGHDLFISNHLRGDELIVAAFAGMAGGARDPDPPAPPPMTQAAFIALARDWLDRGHAACEVEGTITQVETVHSDEVWHERPYIDDNVVQDATRTVTITVSGGAYQAHIEVHGVIMGTHIQHLHDAQGQPCTLTLTTKDEFSGTTSGVAAVAVKDTVFFADTKPELGQRDYRIDVRLPAERTQRTSSGTVADGCGMGTPDPTPDALVLDWDPSAFVLEGHLDDPRGTNLVGACDRMVKHREVGTTKGVLEMSCNRFGNMGNSEAPWLMNQANIGFRDGTDVAFRVQSFWNIRYGK
jgi:hypothetical protein